MSRPRMKGGPGSKRWQARVAFPLLLVAFTAPPTLERLAATAVIALVGTDALAQAEDLTGTAGRKPHKQKRPRDYANDAAAQAQPANTPSGRAANMGGTQREQDAQIKMAMVLSLSLLLTLVVVLMVRVMVRRMRKRQDATPTGTQTKIVVGAAGENDPGKGKPIAPSADQTVLADGSTTGSPGSSPWEGKLETSSWTLAGMAPDRLAQLQKSHIVGKVTHFDVREEGYHHAGMNKAVWNFRVEAGAGESSEQIYSVEMRSKFFNGAIKNGDVVAFEKKHFRRGRVTKLRAILNVSGGDVEVRTD